MDHLIANLNRISESKLLKILGVAYLDSGALLLPNGSKLGGTNAKPTIYGYSTREYYRDLNWLARHYITPKV